MTPPTPRYEVLRAGGCQSSTPRVYHRDVGFPPGLEDRLKGMLRGKTLTYSQHARHAAVTDRYGVIMTPPRVVGEDWQVIEVEVRGLGVPSKGVLRAPYGGYQEQFDLVLVILTQPTGLVKTMWLNRRGDKHYTLDKTYYSTL